jgi:hypothetical protein
MSCPLVLCNTIGEFARTGMASGERSVVVTGVSTGIGWEIANTLCQRGFHVYGSVRKEEDAAKTKKDFGPHFTPLVFDVRDDDAIKRAAAQAWPFLPSPRPPFSPPFSLTVPVFLPNGLCLCMHRHLVKIGYPSTFLLCCPLSPPLRSFPPFPSSVRFPPDSVKPMHGHPPAHPTSGSVFVVSPG